MSRHHNARWIGRTGSRPGLIAIRRHALDRTGAYLVTRKRKVTRARKSNETTRDLRLAREAENEVADFALGKSGIEVEVEDCAFVGGRYGG